ncbi:MAG: tetratricopeptide (TPR) repeat protein [Chlamydiales bacterium]|jgi:tetratricopeptide (TPR) repeat protein
MSFQGDVRGIGLGELLQGLCRGRKEGVLTLTAADGSLRTLGVEEGLVYLLPEPEEDAEHWRDRVRDAWATQPDFRVDYLRMSEIAKADRLEKFYELTDSGGANFRFEPCSLPNRSMGQEADADRTDVYCEGMAVDYLLLEYARLSDELGGADGALAIDEGAMPLLLDPTAAQRSKLLAACDDKSTLREIADRLGWPLRQCKLSLWKELTKGSVRLAAPEEILRRAFVELASKNHSRAAIRLSAWCNSGIPGPMTADQGEAFGNEWLAGRLPAALEAMGAKDVRTLLRRLDHVLDDKVAALAHWREAARQHPADLVARMRCLALEARDRSDPEVPGLDELLALARTFRQGSVPRRAGPVLVLAAHMQPESHILQFEIGQGLVSAGRPYEGSPWLLTAARELLERGAADRVVGPLRQLLEADPGNRECRQLLSLARRSSTSTKNLRRGLLISLGITAAVSAVAFVRLRAEQDYEERVHQVREALNDPDNALLTLESNFPEDSSAQIVALRAEIRERQATVESELRGDWLALYRDAQADCTIGDPARGLLKVIALPQPPALRNMAEPWPLQSDLYRALHESLLNKIASLGPPIEDAPDQLAQEDLALRQIDEMTALLDEHPELAVELSEFRDNLAATTESVEGRILERAEMIAERIQSATMENQDSLLVQARKHARMGEFQRALRKYEELLLTDPDGRVRQVLEPEMEHVRAQDQAVKDARRLASEGQHQAAFEALADKFENPESFVLPWTVETRPSGATVHLSSGGERTTPFVIETTFGESITMVFEAEGFDTIERTIETPSDQLVYLSRTPDCFWATEGRVDALPVAIDGGHVIADRQGQLARINAAGTVWEASIPTLSGIARAPVALPQRPGHLLVVTEDGAVWILDTEAGQFEGPWQLSSSPVVGPYPTQGSVRMILRNGSVACWKNRLKPTIVQDRGINTDLETRFRHGTDSGLAVLRRGESLQGEFEAPWSDWAVTIGREAFVVGDGEQSFTVERSGPWGYLAWEAPGADLPLGRLWISDDFGLRAVRPN